MKKPLLLLIDSNALIHRAYHAYPSTLTTSKGQQINAVFGFFSILLQVLLKYKPDQIFFAFDVKEKTFRNEIYPDYKATRKKTDAELIEQFKIVKDILLKINFNVVEKAGYEADDLIGTLSRRKEFEGKEKIIITGDGDLLQLIRDDVKVFLSGSAFQKSVLYDSKTAQEKLGYTVDQIIEYKGLRGDSSDNIPGVKGIGEISAKKLLSKYKTLEEIYSNLEELDNTVKNKLVFDRESAFVSRDLATIDTNAPLDEKLNNSKPTSVDFAQLRKLFFEFEFKSLLPKIDKLESELGVGSEENISQQSEMFNVDKAGGKTPPPKGRVEQYLSTIPKGVEYVAFYPKFSDQKICTEVLVWITENAFFELKCDAEEYKRFVENISKSSVKVIAFDSKILNKTNIFLGIPQLEIHFDIKLAAYLLTGGRLKLCLEDIAYEFIGNFDITKSRAEITYELFDILSKKISKEKQLSKLLFELEIPLTEALAIMELAGIKLDKDYLQQFEKRLVGMIKGTEKKIYDLAGQEFNIASPKQMGEVLFSKLKLPGGKKNKSGGFSTNEKVLRNLVTDFPIIKEILKYREYTKLKSTYTSTLISHIDPGTGRVHSVFHQDIAATGRLSSKDPNLQNIPISSELGQEVRRAFISEKGKKFVFFDYSQQELRLLAHLSGDKNLTKAFNKGVDIHSLTASRLLTKEISDVTKSERRMGKTVNFGIVYGISAFGLSEQLKIDPKLAQKYIDSFFVTYEGVKKYFDNLLAEARKNDYITTILGRRKITDGLRSPVFQVRKATEREIINFPLQGSAADMIKMAMVKTQKIIDDKYSDFAQMVLQIHDELVFEVVDDKNEDRLKEFARDIRKELLEVFDLEVNMKVDTEVGYNLADSHNFSLK